MANEVRASVRLTAKLGSFGIDQSVTQAFNHPSVKGGNPGTVSFTTTEEDVNFGDVTPGRVMLINLSTSNSFAYGAKDTTMKQLCRMGPKDVNLITMTTAATLRAKAVSGTVNVHIIGLSATT